MDNVLDEQQIKTAAITESKSNLGVKWEKNHYIERNNYMVILRKLWKVLEISKQEGK